MSAFCIVTPTLNAGALLDETARSVVRSLSPGDRYIIIDGGSTDGSLDTVRAWAPSTVDFLRDSGLGMYDAIATGFSHGNEPLMAWINASDLYLGGALDWVRSEFTRTRADLLHFDDYYIDAARRVICRSAGSVGDVTTAMNAGWTPLQDGCFWTRDLYHRCGGLTGEWKLAGDFGFFLRAFRAGRAVHGRGVVSAFRQHEGQLSRSQSRAYNDERQKILTLARAKEPESGGTRIMRAATRVSLSVRARLRLNRIRSRVAGADAQLLCAAL